MPPSPSPHGDDRAGTRRKGRKRPRTRYRYVNKWVSFSASLTSLLGAGLSYAFALYAGDLKQRFRYSQRQTDGVAAFMNLGGYLGVPAGLLYDFMLRRGYRRAGPRIVMLLGALISAGGYLSLWRLEVASAAGGGSSPSGRDPLPPPSPSSPSPSPPSFALVCLSAFAAANGASFLDCSAMATAVRNHRGAQRGGAVGALKAAVGLSGSLFAAAFLAGFSSSSSSGGPGGDAPKFLLFLAAAPLALAVAASAFVNVVPFEQDDEVGVALSGGGGNGGDGGVAADAASAAAVSPTAAASPSSSSTSSFDLLSPSARVAASSGVLLLLALYVTGATLVLRGPGGPAALTKEARASLSLGLAAAAGGLALLPSWGAGLWARRAPSSSSSSSSGGRSAAAAAAGGEEGEEEGEEGEISSCSECESEEGEGLDDDEDGGEEEEREGAQDEENGEQQQQRRPLLLPPASSSTPHPPPVLRDPSFWLLFAACTSGAAAGLSFINNAAQIAASAGAPPEAAPVLVSAFSVANCVGRLAFGSFSEKALHLSRGRVPRPVALAVAALMAAAASAALAVSRSGEPPGPGPLPPPPPSPPPPPPSPTPTPSLSPLLLLPLLSSGVPLSSSFPPSFASSYPSSPSPSSSLLLPAVAAVAGAAFGGMWSLMAAATADLFGVRRYASVYAMLQASSLLISDFEISKNSFPRARFARLCAPTKKKSHTFNNTCPPLSPRKKTNDTKNNNNPSVRPGPGLLRVRARACREALRQGRGRAGALPWRHC